jgi:hypothetical protein
MVVAISVGSVLASVALGLIGVLLGVDRGGRRHLHETNSLGRLAVQFRADVATAEDVTSDERSGLHLRLGEGRIVDYASEPAQATREERVGEDRLMREQYALPEEASLDFEIAGDERLKTASMSLAPAVGASDPGSPRLGWRIEATIGRELRFSPRAPNGDGERQAPAESKP